MRSRSSAEGLGPAAPHRVELDERPVLVEDDEVDAVETAGHTSAPVATSGPDEAAVSASARTKHASGGNDTEIGSPTTGSLQPWVVERVERDRRRLSAIARTTEVHAQPDDRAEEADVLERAADPVPVLLALAELDALRADRERDTRTGAGDRDRLGGPDLLAGQRQASGRRIHDHRADEVERADERGHEACRGEVVDLEGRADLLDPALAHHDHAIGQRQRLLLVVGDVDRRDAELALDRPDLHAQRRPGSWRRGPRAARRAAAPGARSRGRAPARRVAAGRPTAGTGSDRPSRTC